MNSDVEKIKERLDIVDVVGVYVKLQKAGKNYKGLSPFTSEKTPSFFVSPERGLYHCFSSGKGGDIFTFIQEIEGLDFFGSLKFLADQAGIELDHSTQRVSKDEKDYLFGALDQAANFYEKKLTEYKSVMKYVRERGLDEKTVRHFRLGYAPTVKEEGWDPLFKKLRKDGSRADDLLKAGLIRKGKEGTYHDYFRGRLMFPLMDSVGRVVGFSGRELEGGEGPKYLNTPDTPIFHKGSLLYGLQDARNAIRKHSFSILVEGQFDLLLAHQAGWRNTVATSGTAFTDTHLKMLSRLSQNLLLAFDSDRAGRESARKVSSLALSFGMNVKIAPLPLGKDPADIISEDPQKWRHIVRSAVHTIDYELGQLASLYGLRSREYVRAVRTIVLPLIAAVPERMEQSYFISEVVSKTAGDEGAVREEVGKIMEGKKNRGFIEKIRDVRGQAEDPSLSLIKHIAGIVLFVESKDKPLFNTEKIRVKVEELCGKEALLGFEEQKESLIFRAEVLTSSRGDLEHIVTELLIRLEEIVVTQKLNQNSEALKTAEKEENEGGIKHLLEEHRELTHRRGELLKNLQNLR